MQKIRTLFTLVVFGGMIISAFSALGNSVDNLHDNLQARQEAVFSAMVD